MKETGSQENKKETHIVAIVDKIHNFGSWAVD